MARTLTKSEFEEAIAPVESLRTAAAPVRDWRFGVEDNRIVARAGDAEFQVSESGMEQALQKVPGLSKAAVKQWPVELLIDTVNWFYENGSSESARALLKDDSMVGFVQTDAPMVPVSQVLSQIETSLSAAGADLDELSFANVRIDADRVAFGLALPSRNEQPKAGDVVHGGIWTMHSPTARRGGEISPYVSRLVCTNGMISSRSLQKWTWRSGGENLMQWIDSAVTESWTSLDREFEGLRELTEQRLNGHASAVVEDLFDRHRVPAGLRTSVLDAVIDEADGTMYGIAQAFNRAANSVADVGHMRGLLMVTGDVAAQEERCGSCFRYL